MHDSWQDFWAMGGYARYVWPCYAIALGVLIGSWWTARRALASAEQELRRSLLDDEVAS
jgi:heme exporter protein CcmD